jgi:predicted ATPase/signal transduction histidine kinase
VRELQKPVVRERGFFIAGKFDQYKRDIPYSTIVQAFQELVLGILAEGEARIAAFRQRLLDALGVNAQLIAEVIPQVELVIGRQPKAPELPPAEARNRFHIVFRQFIGVFAQREHPLALFLDDLQWADSASLGLLEDLMTHPGTRHLLVVGAYRDNEVTPAHPLMLALDKVRREGARVADIVLGPLSREHLAALVSETLHGTREEVAPLSDLIHDKTGGNPFFAIQFLTSLHEEGLIEFDPEARVFRWDATKIRAKSFTDNVVDLMLGKLRRLPAATQEALQDMACLGTVVEVSILALAHGSTEAETHTHLWEAVRAGLVLRLEGTYKFLHDRVQEAAYSLIPEAQRAGVHLRIGRARVSRLPEEAIAERVFDIANQLDHGVEIITDPHEKELLCRLNVQAGRKAKASIAFASAQRYLAQAAALLSPDVWAARYEDTFALYLDLAECEYLVGNFQRADALFGLLLEKARSPHDCVKVYRLRMRLYQIAGRYDDAMAAALDGLRLFGVTLPASEEAIAAALDAESREVSVNLRGRRIADLADAPLVADPDVRAIIGLLVESLGCAFNARPQLFSWIVLRALNFSLRYGNTDDACLAYMGYGLMLVSILGDIPSGYQFAEMSLRLNEKLDDRRRRGQLLHIHADHINFWRRHFATGLPILERAFVECLEVGDVGYAGHIAFHTVWQHVEKGDPIDEVLQVSQKYADFARQSHNDAVYHTIRLEQHFLSSLQGERCRPALDAGFDEAASAAAVAEAAFGGGLVYHHAMKLIAAFLHGRYAEALESAGRAASMLEAARATPMEATYHFYYALTLAALHPKLPAAEAQAYAQILDEELQKLELWAASCPENYLGRRALVRAEVARIKGQDLDAMRHYEEAIRSARENSFVHQEALAYELSAQFYRARGFEQIADTYLRDARACYARWGADGKVELIDQQNPRLVEPRAITPTITFAIRPEQFDLLAVTKASQIISGEIVLDKLLRTLLETVLEQGCAQRACLILCRDEPLSIDAEAVLDENGTVTSALGPLPVEDAQRFPASLIHYAQRTKERVILADAAADAGKFSGDGYLSRHRPVSVLCMPIVRQAKAVGLLYLENNLLAGAFTPDRLVALQLLATQAAIALENALLLSKERAARAAAEDAERRAAFIARAGALVSESLDHEESLARLSRLCAGSLGDWCVIDVVEGREIRRIAGAHRDPAKEPVLRELSRRYPPRWDSPHPAVTVLRTGEPLLMPEVHDDFLRATSECDEHFRLLRALGTQTGLAVPLVARGQTLGVLTLASAAPGRRFGRYDLELSEEVARRAATAIDNARLYQASQEAVRVRDEFLVVASHELNTPVTSLTLNLQWVRRAIRSERAPDLQAMDRRLERALQQGARLARLNSDLLDVSRIHANRLPLDLEDVDLHALVRAVVERFKSEPSHAGVSVSIQGSGPVVGRWDRSRIEQILANLLSNAIKFGAGKPIEILFGEEAGFARLSVRDQGIGIDPAMQGRIFERFERAVPVDYGGLGLGLYLSRRIAEAHGGTLHVQSTPGAGATFILELPCAGPP